MNIPNLHIFTSTKLSFIHEAHLTADVYAFYFKPQKPLKHRAGQAGFLTVPGGGTKFLTLSSSPDDDLAVFATHIHPASTFKQALGRLHPGDTVKFRGPFIGATLDNKHGTPVVFLTQGIGITPHRSILCHIARSKLPVYTTLIHVDRSGHPFREETQALAMEAYFPESSDEFKRQVLEVAGKQPDAAYYVVQPPLPAGSGPVPRRGSRYPPPRAGSPARSQPARRRREAAILHLGVERKFTCGPMCASSRASRLKA